MFFHESFVSINIETFELNTKKARWIVQYVIVEPYTTWSVHDNILVEPIGTIYVV